CRRTRHQSAGDAKQNDLRCGDGTPGKTLGDVLRVREFVGVLKLVAGVVLGMMMVVMFVLVEFHAASVSVAAVSNRDRRVKFVRFGNIYSRFEKIFLGDELKHLSCAVGTDGFKRHVFGGR